MGEKRAESIHSHRMKSERFYQGIADDVDRLKYILRNIC